jgi:hypothetical protein
MSYCKRHGGAPLVYFDTEFCEYPFCRARLRLSAAILRGLKRAKEMKEKK